MTDYSKLSNEDLIALKDGDYSKVSNEGLLALKGSSEQPVKAEPSFGATKDYLLDQVKKNTPVQMRGFVPGMTPEFNKGGEDIATGLASKGIEPHLAAAAGTTFQMLPDLITSVEGMGAKRLIGEPVAQEAKTVLKAVTPGARAKVGRMIGEAEKLAGVESRVPTVANTAKKLGLPPRERSFSDILNAVKTKLDKGEPIAAQELTDFRDLVKQQYGTKAIAKGTRLDAIAAQTNKAAETALNKAAPGRAIPAKEYAKIVKYQKQLKLLAKAAGGTAGLGLAGTFLRKMVK